jgi:hypothetical protein
MVYFQKWQARETVTAAEKESDSMADDQKKKNLKVSSNPSAFQPKRTKETFQKT